MKHKQLGTIAVAAVAAVAALAVVVALSVRGDGERMTGTVETAELAVAAPLEARVAHIYVTEGDYVKAGDTLLLLVVTEPDADIDTASFDAQLADIDAVRSVLRQAEEGVEAARRHYNEVAEQYARSTTTVQQRDDALSTLKVYEAQWITAKEQYERAINPSSLAEKAFVTATAEGEVKHIACKRGDTVANGAAIVTISILDDLWGRFEISARQRATIALGDTIWVEVPAFNAHIAMLVATVSERIDYTDDETAHRDAAGGTHTYEMRARPLASTHGLRAGMQLTVDIDGQKGSPHDRP